MLPYNFPEIIINLLIFLQKFLISFPPEAIWNLVTPVATPQSVRPGIFHPSGHTMACQTGFFF